MDARRELLTQTLSSATRGDTVAAARLLPLVYEELRDLARARLSRLPPGQTLQATALVHEAYLRIATHRGRDWEGRAQFFFAAARAMRDILVESARRKASLKRGGQFERLPLDDVEIKWQADGTDLLALESALEELERVDSDGTRLVMLRYFAGLSLEETAELLEVSEATLKRRWRFVRTFLYRSMTGEGAT